MEPLQKYNRRDICFFGILRTPRHDFWMITSKIAGGIFFIHAFPFGDLFEKRKCEKWSILQICFIEYRLQHKITYNYIMA